MLALSARQRANSRSTGALQYLAHYFPNKADTLWGGLYLYN